MLLLLLYACEDKTDLGPEAVACDSATVGDDTGSPDSNPGQGGDSGEPETGEPGGEDSAVSEICAHPDVATLAAVADLGVSDLLFDEDCFAYLSTVLTWDEIQLVHPSGVEIASFESWDGITDLPALALDPVDGEIWVAGVTVTNAAMVGRVVNGAVEKVADGEYTLGTSWIGVYLNRDAQSIASDGDCVWVPNFAGDGTVVCVAEDGTQTVLTTLPERAESVAISPDGTLYASSGHTIWALDADGGATEAWTFDGTVLDFVFDTDGSVYVETSDDLVLHATAEGTSTFAEVAYDGKLTITPDRWLVRLMPYWDGGTADIASLWEEWPLDG